MQTVTLTHDVVDDDGNETASSRPAWLRSLPVEGLGLLVAATLGIAAVAILMPTPRGELLFFGADSTVMPLVAHSIQAGDPFQWRMTSTVFLIEVPVYYLICLIFPTAVAAVVASGVLNFVLLYATVRAVLAVLAPTWARGVRIATALATCVIPVVAVSLETSTTVRSAEVASMLLATSYYYPVTIAMIGCVALLAHLIRSRAAAPERSLGRYSVVVTVVTTVLVASNPLYIGWVGVPLVLTLAVLAVTGRIQRSAAVLVGVAFAVGGVLAWCVRVLLSDYLGPNVADHFGDTGNALEYYRRMITLSAATWRGSIELVLLAALIVLSVVVAVVAWRRNSRPELLFVALAGPIITGVVFVGALVAGAGAARYLQPMLFAPLMSVPVAVVLWSQRRRLPEIAFARRPAGRWAAVLGSVLLVVLSAQLARAATNHTFAPARCLEDWLGDRQLLGAADFWVGRSFVAFGAPSIDIIQINPDGSESTWMTNAYDYRPRRIDYFLAEIGPSWNTSDPGDPPRNGARAIEEFGSPNAIVSCAEHGFMIYDYTGTPGSDELSRRATGWQPSAPGR